VKGTRERKHGGVIDETGCKKLGRDLEQKVVGDIVVVLPESNDSKTRENVGRVDRKEGHAQSHEYAEDKKSLELAARMECGGYCLALYVVVHGGIIDGYVGGRVIGEEIGKWRNVSVWTTFSKKVN